MSHLPVVSIALMLAKIVVKALVETLATTPAEMQPREMEVALIARVDVLQPALAIAPHHAKLAVLQLV